LKKIAVTGATGFVGIKVVEELLRRGYEVVTVSRSSEVADSVSWKGKTTHLSFDLVKGYKDDGLFAFLGGVGTVIHLAWDDLDDYYADSHLEQQLSAHMVFLKNLVMCGADNISVAGTCLEYGLHNGCLNEAMLTSPVLPYGRAKDTLRHYLQLLQRKHPFSMKWFRYFYIDGNSSRRRSSLLTQLDQAIENGDSVFNMSGGEQLRDYVHIDKFAEYTVVLALQPENMGVVNICSGSPVSVRQLVENRIRERNASIELNLGYYSYPEYEPMAFWGDDAKLSRLLR